MKKHGFVPKVNFGYSRDGERMGNKRPEGGAREIARTVHRKSGSGKVKVPRQHSGRNRRASGPY